MISEFSKMNLSSDTAKVGGGAPFLPPLSSELRDIASLRELCGGVTFGEDPSDDEMEDDSDSDYSAQKNSKKVRKRKHTKRTVGAGRKSTVVKTIDKMTTVIRSMQKAGKIEAEIVNILKQVCVTVDIGVHLTKLESLIARKTVMYEETQLDIFSRIGAHNEYPEYTQLQAEISTLGFEDLVAKRESIKATMKHYREYLCMLEDAEKLVDLQFNRLEPEAATHKYLFTLLTQVESEKRAEFRTRNAF